MLTEMRTYTIRPAGIAEFLKTYRELGWPLQKKYLGICNGWYTVADGGLLNQVVHIWSFTDHSDRDRRYGNLTQDPAWATYLKAMGAQGHLLSAENKFLRPTGFFTKEQGAQ